MHESHANLLIVLNVPAFYYSTIQLDMIRLKSKKTKTIIN